MPDKTGLSKNGAIKAMLDGKRVRHRWFSNGEWMQCSIWDVLKERASLPRNIAYEFEDGVICPADEFWHFRQEEDWHWGWEICGDAGYIDDE